MRSSPLSHRALFRKRLLETTATALALLGSSAVCASGQTVPHALATWIGLDVSAGDERAAVGYIQRADMRWRIDEQGNYLLRVGQGGPRKVIACALDHTT